MAINSLSGRYEGSFAYITIKDRLPVILTNIIDHLCREKINLSERYGEGSSEELKLIISKLSKLKSNLQTNKPLTYITDPKDNHVDQWNSHILSYCNRFGEDPKWFTASWLFAECYFYKSIIAVFHLSEIFSKFDPYEHLKFKAYEEATNSITSLVKFLSKSLRNIEKAGSEKQLIAEMIKFSLWGNQCDLSISSGFVLSEDEKDTSLNNDESILVDEFEYFWDFISNTSNEERKLAIVLDNAGFELVTDLCLAAAFYKLGFFSSITFYVKSFPWFVSDTTKRDLRWTLDNLSEIEDFGMEFSNYFDDGVWEVKEHPFWTLPFSFNEMNKRCAELYNDLGQYSLAIFKGDLNYRKLVSDMDWPRETKLQTALQGFNPCPLLVVRTIKGGPVVGLDLKSSRVKKAFLKDNWFRSGDFGVIQFVSIKSYIKRYVGLIFLVAFVPLCSILIRKIFDL